MGTGALTFARIALILAATVASTAITAEQTPLTAEQAVARYARGDFDAAVRDLDTRRLNAAPFTRALDGWIAAGDRTSEPRRRTVAIAFALDASWAATRYYFNLNRQNYDPWKRVTPDDPERWSLANYWSQQYVARWAAERLPQVGTPPPVERLLWLTAVGIAEDGHGWHQLQHEILPLSHSRLPDEPRLRLAGVLARTNRDLGSLRMSGTSARHDVLRREDLPSSVTGRIPQAIKAFETLMAEPALTGEAELRIGYLELRRDRWADALRRFNAARVTAREPILQAAADYLAGWTLEQQGQSDQAVTAYRRAHALTPLMRNLATRLSALLFLRNERAEAYAVLEPALNARPAPVDFLLIIERADARFVPDWLASIRKALQ